MGVSSSPFYLISLLELVMPEPAGEGVVRVLSLPEARRACWRRLSRMLIRSYYLSVLDRFFLVLRAISPRMILVLVVNIKKISYLKK